MHGAAIKKIVIVASSWLFVLLYGEVMLNDYAQCTFIFLRRTVVS